MNFKYLDMLEAESIYIIREAIAEAENPALLYSIGKDSSVMLHLTLKAFYPAKPPLPLLHIDTTWKFREMLEFRDSISKQLEMELIIHTNRDGVAQKITPYGYDATIYTNVMKTTALKQAIKKYKFDTLLVGARRDEEKSRAKERIFSLRDQNQRWDPKNQRPELWNIYNGYKNAQESFRIFPLSNWTEKDIWQYIYHENIKVVPLYYAAYRPVITRNGILIMVDDERLPLKPREKPKLLKVRFRTLGCYPLTGAIESTADTDVDILNELSRSKHSERQQRLIDHDGRYSMEKKKQEGYF